MNFRLNCYHTVINILNILSISLYPYIKYIIFFIYIHLFAVIIYNISMSSYLSSIENPSPIQHNGGGAIQKASHA